MECFSLGFLLIGMSCCLTEMMSNNRSILPLDCVCFPFLSQELTTSYTTGYTETEGGRKEFLNSDNFKICDLQLPELPSQKSTYVKVAIVEEH